MHPTFTIGLSVAAIYAAGAWFVIRCDRTPHNGSWFSLNGILSFLLTLPMSWSAMRLGRKLDYRRNDHMLFAVAGTGLLLASLTALLVWPFCR